MVMLKDLLRVVPAVLAVLATASAVAVESRAGVNDRGEDHLRALRAALGARDDRTVPTQPTRIVECPDERLVVGGAVLELKHRGGAHTPGDVMVSTGDVVVVDRILGVISVNNTRRGLAGFAVIEALQPRVPVPGHGRVTDVATAKADAPAYLLALRGHSKQAVNDGVDLNSAARFFDAKPFARLPNAAEVMPGNGSRTYPELERE